MAVPDRAWLTGGLAMLDQECPVTGNTKHLEAINWLSSWRHSEGWKMSFPLATRFR